VRNAAARTLRAGIVAGAFSLGTSWTIRQIGMEFACSCGRINAGSWGLRHFVTARQCKRRGKRKWPERTVDTSTVDVSAGRALYYPYSCPHPQQYRNRAASLTLRRLDHHRMSAAKYPTRTGNRLSHSCRCGPGQEPASLPKPRAQSLPIGWCDRQHDLVARHLRLDHRW
jgi:hypothetical protein